MSTDRSITDLPADQRPDGWPWEVTTAERSDRLDPAVLEHLSRRGGHGPHLTDRVGYLRPSLCPACATIVRLIEGTDPMPGQPALGHSPCCSSHGVDMTCERYRRTHFVEVRPCCAADAARLTTPEPTPVQLAAALLRGRAERADTLGLTEVGVPVDQLRLVLDAWAATL